MYKGGLIELDNALHRQCCTEGQVRQYLTDCNIAKLYKSKGDRGDCNNYRGISLLSIVGIFACAVLNKLHKMVDREHLPRVSLWLYVRALDNIRLHGLLAAPFTEVQIAEAVEHCLQLVAIRDMLQTLANIECQPNLLSCDLLILQNR